MPVLHAVKIALSKSHLAGHPAVQVIAEYTLTIIVAYGLMATVERWSIKLRDKWFPRLGEPAA